MESRPVRHAIWLFPLVFAACHNSDVGAVGGPSSPGRLPLDDLGGGSYLGYTGGLYPNGSNSPPTLHDSVGLARARSVTPLDTAGNPDPAGKMVLVSLGMSNTTQEFCSGASTPNACTSSSFMGQAAADPAVNHTKLAIVNGARGGQDARTWVSATAANYDSVRLNRLAPLGLTERQVEIVWVKEADAGPTVSLPAPQADAYQLEIYLGNIARALKSRYPNLKLVFFSSRIYAGYATTALNPEPYAYESGFAVKWLVGAQIAQRQNGGTVSDSRAGDLNYSSTPWLGWAAYLWADGMTPRSDGLTWAATDFGSDGTHPSQAGAAKVAGLLLAFFKGSPYTRCWFLNGGTCS
jgi:hypothetical protein